MESIILFRSGVGVSPRVRPVKLFHCVRLPGRSANSAVSASGMSAGINLLRELGSPSAIHVWGARTMSGSVMRRYVAVSRFLRHLEFSMTRSLGWVSESVPGDINPAIVEILLNDYLYEYFLQGAFVGTTQAQSYFVSCNSEPPALGCLVGVAIIRPLEFEIIRLAIPYRDALFASRFETE